MKIQIEDRRVMERRKGLQGIPRGAYAPEDCAHRGDATTEKASGAAVEVRERGCVCVNPLGFRDYLGRVCGICFNCNREIDPNRGTTGVTGGAPAQPPQASTRPSASTTPPTQAPKVSEAMLEAGRNAERNWWTSDVDHDENDAKFIEVYTAMELKRQEEQDWDGLGPGGA